MKKKSVFTQPECRVYRVSNNNVIATSGNAPAHNGANEEYETGDTSSWF